MGRMNEFQDYEKECEERKIRENCKACYKTEFLLKENDKMREFIEYISNSTCEDIADLVVSIKESAELLLKGE